MLVATHIGFLVDKKPLLHNITASFEPGKLHLILGPNGAGKSTLIKLLSGELVSKEGSIKLSEKKIEHYSLSELATKRAVLSQNVELSFPLKVHEVVMMGRYPHFESRPSQLDEEVCKDAMNFFDITSFSKREYLTLSGGEKQRVHFARVLAQISHTQKVECRYLFLDEPLTFLDVQYQFQFMRLLKKLLKQQPLVIIGVVHDLNLAAKFADQLLLLHKGKLLVSGCAEKVLTSQHIETAYGLTPMLHKTKNGLHLFFE